MKLSPDVSISLLKEFFILTEPVRHWWETHARLPSQTPHYRLLAVSFWFNCCKLSLVTLLSNPPNIWLEQRYGMHALTGTLKHSADGHHIIHQTRTGLERILLELSFKDLLLYSEYCQSIPRNAFQLASATVHRHHMMCTEAFASAYVCLFMVHSMWV